MKILKEKVKENYSNLTQGLKVVATFIVDNPKSVALSTAKEIGVLTNTSETTVIRFCHALGYSGYAALQEDIRKLLLEPDEDPFKALSAGMKDEKNDLTSFVAQDIDYIKRTFENIDPLQFERMIERIVQAKKIIIVGLRASYGPATWLAYSLNIVKGDTILFRGDIDDANYFMTLIEEGWLIITLTFKRYSQQSVTFVRAAKEKNAEVIAITDDELSPIGLISDFTIKVISPNPTSLKGMPIIFSILNAIVSGVMAQNSIEVESRIKNYQLSNDYYHSFYKLEE